MKRLPQPQNRDRQIKKLVKSFMMLKNPREYSYQTQQQYPLSEGFAEPSVRHLFQESFLRFKYFQSLYENSGYQDKQLRQSSDYEWQWFHPFQSLGDQWLLLDFLKHSESYLLPQQLFRLHPYYLLQYPKFLTKRFLQY